LYQAPAGGKSGEGFNDHEDSDKAQQRMQERRSTRMTVQAENGVGDDIRRDSHQAIERRQRQPEDSQEANMLADSTALRITRHHSCRNFFSAPAAKELIRL
jgi:hypothetical protein